MAQRLNAKEEVLSLLNRLKSTASNFVGNINKPIQNFYDNKGYFQQGRFTTQPLNRPIVNKAVNVIKPQVQGFWQGLNESQQDPYTNKTSGYSIGRGISGGALTPVVAPIQTAGRFISKVPTALRLAQEWGPSNEIYKQGQASTERRIANTPRLRNNPQLAETERFLDNFLTMGTLSASSIGATRNFKGVDLRKIVNPNEEEIMRNFSITVSKLKGKANKAILGDLGENADYVVQKVFGNKFRSLPNTKIAQMFDYLLARLDESRGNPYGGVAIKPKGVQMPVGLQTQEAEGLAQQALKGKPPKPQGIISKKSGTIPKVPPQIEVKQQTPQLSTKTPSLSQGGIAQSSGGGSSNSIIQPKTPYFNINRVGVDAKGKEFIKKTIDEVKPQIEKVVGKPLSHEEIIKTANQTASKLSRTIGREETEKLGAQALNLRNSLAKMVQEGKASPETIDALIKDKAFGQHIARLLGQRRIVSDPSKGTLINQIVENVLKNNKNVDEILAEAKRYDFNDPRQATEFYRKFVKPKMSDWIDALRYNSMLSSPNTHIVNISSNFQGTGIITPIEKTLTGAIDFLSSKVTGKQQQHFAGEGIEYAKGYYSKLHEAAHKFADVISGKKLTDVKEVYNIPLTTKGPKKVVENVLTFPAKLLQGADEFFQTLTEGGLKKTFEYKAKRGVKIDNPDLKAFEEGRKRMFNAKLGLKEEGMVLKALEYIPQKVLEARNSNNPIISTIAKYSFPFVRIPANIFKQGVEYSPLGISTIPGASNKTEQLSKAILGSSIGIASSMLIASDRITFSEPTDPKNKEAFRASGMQPYSIKIGDKWVSYAKLHPAISTNLAIIAALRNAELKKQLTDGQIETVLNGLGKFVNFYADQSYLKNLGDLVSTAKGDVEGVTRYLFNYPSQLIPFRALMSWVTRIVDPYQRKVDPKGGMLEKQLQYLMTQIPGLSQNVPARIGPDGKPIENTNRGINAISPNRVTTENPELKKYYQQIQDTSKIRSDINAVEGTSEERVTNLRNQLKSLTSEGRRQYLISGLKDGTLKEQDVRNFINDLKLNAKGVGYQEKQLLGQPIKVRATYISSFLKGKTNDEKKAILIKYAKTGILTKDVLRQIIINSQSR